MGHAAGTLLILLAHGLRLVGDLLGSVSDLVLALAAVAIFIFIAGRLDTKKPPARLPDEMPAPTRSGEQRRPEVALDIPSRARASGYGKDGVYQETAATEPAAGVKNRYQQYLEAKRRQESQTMADGDQAARDRQESPRPVLALTPDAMMNAVIYAEIIGRPKAYQNRRR